MARAIEIVGLSERVMQQMAEAGELPGAIKIRGVWTFDEQRLFEYLADLEKQQCETRRTVAGERSRPARTRTGAARGTRKPYGRGSKSRASPSAGRSDYDGLYDQAISKLLAIGSKPGART
jgi:hypothetical protein